MHHHMTIKQVWKYRARLVVEIKWDGMGMGMVMGMGMEWLLHYHVWYGREWNGITTPFLCLVWQGMECPFYSFFLFSITK